MIAFLILVLVAAVVVYGLVFSASQKSRTKSGNRTGHLDRQFVSERWQAIEAMAAGGGSGLRNAVSEADKLVDYALKHSGVRGDTMGDRLKASGNRFSNVDAMWRAHKLRNALAHEVGFDLVKPQADEALADYKRGLQDLGVL